MKEELELFNKRFNITYDEKENNKRFKNSLCTILSREIGNISLKIEFRNEFIKYTGIEHKDFGTVDSNTEIDVGQKDWLDISGKNYIKFNNTCIGKAFQEDIVNVIRYIQIIFLMDNNIIPSLVKSKLCKEINEIADIYNININIVKSGKNEYLVYPKGAKELDDALVNEMLIWMDKFPKAKANYYNALEKYSQNGNLRNILDDLRLSLELLIQGILENKKSIENNKNEICKYLKDNNINKEITNMFYTILDYYMKYQDNNVKHDENCYEQEAEFIIYITGTFMRLLLQEYNNG